jgi:hypothetical protein
MPATIYTLADAVSSAPADRPVVYCDGTAGAAFRADVDVELSHWIPNRTPRRFKADTSTEIAFRFLDDRGPLERLVAVNNHVDVDGLLSVYAVTHPETALAHRQTLIQAAEIGDFWAWGERPAQVLFQGLTLLTAAAPAHDEVPATYERCFARIPDLLQGTDPLLPEIESGIAALHRSLDLIETGRVRRHEYHDRFTAYELPADVCGGDLERAWAVAEFNEALSDRCLLWPQARNRRDGQKVQLVACETEDGWHFDLWYPGYMWADFADRWRAPGYETVGGMSDYRLDHPPLTRAIAALREREPGPASWELATLLSPFEKSTGRPFPVVATVSRDGRPAASGLSPEVVGEYLAAAFTM